MAQKALTAKREAFAQAYARLGNGVAAYLEAYPKAANWTPAAQSANASETLAREDVSARIIELRQPAADRATMTAGDVLNEWCVIATADPRELIRSKKWNCRYCNGKDHAYQWRDTVEFWKALDNAADAEQKRQDEGGKGKKIALPTDDGGYGFKSNRPPHPECPQCDGEGYNTVFIEDAANYSPAAVKLYAGIKKTKDGVQILMRDQSAALTNIAKFLGMLVERTKLEGGVSVANVSSSLTTAQAEAIARVLIDKI